MGTRANRSGVPGLGRIESGARKGRWFLDFRHGETRATKLYPRAWTLTMIRDDARRIVESVISGTYVRAVWRRGSVPRIKSTNGFCLAEERVSGPGIQAGATFPRTGADLVLLLERAYQAGMLAGSEARAAAIRTALGIGAALVLFGCSGDVSVLEAEPEPEPEIVEVRADVTLRDEAGSITATCEDGIAVGGRCDVNPIHGAELAELVSEASPDGWTCAGSSVGVVRVTAWADCEVTP